MMKAIDASMPVTPHLAAVKAAHIETVIRYIGQPGWPKDITKGEAEAIRKVAKLGFVYELGAGWMGGGRSAGVTAAKQAQAHLAQLGCKDPVVVYLACDTDTLKSPVVLACLDGAASVIGKHRVGLYGGLAAITAAKTAGYTFLWQTVAWSYGHKASGICLFQHLPQTAPLGFDHDPDDQYGPCGAWGEAAAVVPYGAMKKAAIAVADACKLDHSGVTGDDTFGADARALILRIQAKAPKTPPPGVDYRALKRTALAVAVAIGAGHGGVVTNSPRLLGAARAMLGSIARKVA